MTNCFIIILDTYISIPTCIATSIHSSNMQMYRRHAINNQNVFKNVKCVASENRLRIQCFIC